MKYTVWYYQYNDGIVSSTLDQTTECPVSRVNYRASLVMQRIRIRLPMQETRVRSLIREDPTCCGATKPMHHN